MSDPRAAIEAMVAREKRAWDSKDVDLLMSLLHPDMVWPFPGEARSLDPMSWTAGLGRYDAARWSRDWQALFDDYELVHNRREIRRIVTSEQGDGGFAIVDIDTLWRHADGREEHWLGRTCKIYTKLANDWKMITQLGAWDASAQGDE